MQLDQLKIIVTGGASGMGRVFSTELARAGAKVTVADINVDDLPEGMHGVRANIAQEDDVIRLIAEAAEAMGGLNGLVNNAGIFRDGLLIKRDRETGAVQKMSLDQWNAVIGVDLTGPFLCTREFAARLVQTGTKPGVVVNISSIARHGNRGQSNYSAAKAGLVADTKLWALELASYGIRTGAVAPGFVDTPILQGMRPEVLEAMLKTVPLRRPADPHEIWLAVKFIIECDYFTGKCVDVDGGLTL